MPAGQLAGAPPSAAAAAPAAGQRVGQRTMAVLISSAVDRARAQNGPQKMDTKALSAYVDKQVGKATAGQRRTTAVLAVLLVVALAGLGGLVVWSQWSSDEIDRLRAELANLAPDDPRRIKIERRMGELHPPSPAFGRTLYDQSKKGIFMLASGGQGFCTAFAVRPSVLATNAHCVLAAQRNGGDVVALENESRGQVTFAVTDLHAHPSYRDNDANALTPDVGIVTINGKAATVLAMASPQELSALGAGDDVFLIGFPGRLMDTQNPVATFLGAHVGRVTTSKGRGGAFADAWLVQHDAPTTHGTSGSPIFNNKGHVVAVNSGGYLEGDQETVAGRKTEVVKASPYKFGMRIDLINALLR
jgi:V8-like Glu-specific endopeptidase